MNRWRVVLAVAMLVVGLLWIAQGTGTVAGSAMSGQSVWTIVGVVLVVGGLIIGVRELIRRPVGRG
jgi:hypothetical protein